MCNIIPYLKINTLLRIAAVSSKGRLTAGLFPPAGGLCKRAAFVKSPGVVEPYYF